MFPEWHHAAPESAYFKVPETLKTFRMYSTSKYALCATRLNGFFSYTHAMATDAMFAPYKSRVVSRGGSLRPLTYLPGTSVEKNYAQPAGGPPDRNTFLDNVFVVGPTRQCSH